MKGVIFTGDRTLELRDLPEPEPGHGEVLLKMMASGMCGSDLTRYRMPASDLTAFHVAGHEPCGVVAEVGPGVTEVSVGDRVMMHHYTGCNTCSMCRIGYNQMCLSGSVVYGTGADGGHQDYLLCPAYTCVKMPDELPFDQGAAVACGTERRSMPSSGLGCPEWTPWRCSDRDRSARARRYSPRRWARGR